MSWSGTTPRWLPEDRAAVSMWQQEQWGKCPDCGTFEWEWEENNEAWNAGIHLCLGCKSLAELREETHRNQPVNSAGYKDRLYRRKDDDGQ